MTTEKTRGTIIKIFCGTAAVIRADADAPAQEQHGKQLSLYIAKEGYRCSEHTSLKRDTDQRSTALERE